jgi:hypothetical protein
MIGYFFSLTLPIVFKQVAAHRQLLENAQLVYDGYWGKDINILLEDVPGHGNLQYLPNSQIDPGLQGLCCPKILPVCKDYKDLYRKLQSYWEGSQKLCHGVVITVTSQSGIGMHLQLLLIICTFFNKSTRKVISPLLSPAFPLK